MEGGRTQKIKVYLHMETKPKQDTRMLERLKGLVPREEVEMKWKWVGRGQ